MKWASMIPLIGGFTIGAAQAIGTNPNYIYTFDGFESNDSHCLHYYNKVKHIHNPEKIAKLDLVILTPPCSALSLLNKYSNEEYDSIKYLYETTKICIDSNVTTIIGENAPALFTKKGQNVVKKLFNIIREKGYSISLYQTSTIYHGIPQKRLRTFYIIHKNKNAIYLKNCGNKCELDVYEFLKTRPVDYQQKFNISEYFKIQIDFVKTLKDNKYFRDNISFLYMLKKENLFDDFLTYVEKTNSKLFKVYVKHLNHIRKKLKNGQCFWDNSVFFCKDSICSITSRIMNHTYLVKDDRFLNVSDFMSLMGLPKDFTLVNKNYNHICQNVPVDTAKDVVKMVLTQIEKKQYTNGRIYKFSNIHNKSNAIILNDIF